MARAIENLVCTSLSLNANFSARSPSCFSIFISLPTAALFTAARSGVRATVDLWKRGFPESIAS